MTVYDYFTEIFVSLIMTGYAGTSNVTPFVPYSNEYIFFHLKITYSRHPLIKHKKFHTFKSKNATNN